MQRRRYSNRAAARSAIRNAPVRRSLARGRVPDGAPEKAATEDGTVFQAYYFNEDKILK